MYNKQYHKVYNKLYRERNLEKLRLYDKELRPKHNKNNPLYDLSNVKIDNKGRFVKGSQMLKVSTKINKICFECKKEYKVFKCYSNKKFCSRKCYGDSRKGMYPKYLKLTYGKENPAWKGGITPYLRKLRTTAKYILWKADILKRDKWTCQFCYIKDSSKKTLQVHHIKSYTKFPLIRFNQSNAITLCKKCHKTTYGKEPNFELLCNWILELKGYSSICSTDVN